MYLIRPAASDQTDVLADNFFDGQHLVDFFLPVAYWSKAPKYLRTYVFVDLQ